MAQSVAEYLIALLFVYGGLSLIGRPPLEGEGAVTAIFGGELALYVYMVWFIALGLSLAVAKIFKMRRLHKNTLLGMYLTTIYTAIIASLLLGFDILNIIDDLVVGLTTAGLWLRFKISTEYVRTDEILDYDMK